MSACFAEAADERLAFALSVPPSTENDEWPWVGVVEIEVGSFANGSKARALGVVLIGSVRLTPPEPGSDGALSSVCDGGADGGLNASSPARATLTTEVATIPDARILETFRISQLLRERSNGTDPGPFIP
ncbi:MAG TPA: hypothetical protein VGP63_26380 [Planctomycetaceae bacterium]|nr:hypothetical protein [Planctomycetaceae bacterium]